MRLGMIRCSRSIRVIATSPATKMRSSQMPALAPLAMTTAANSAPVSASVSG